MIKTLKEYHGADGIVKAGQVLTVYLKMLSDERNKKYKGTTDLFSAYTAFMQNTPDLMMELFEILGDENAKSGDAGTALTNMLILSNDEIMRSLFMSQGRRGDAKSSVSAKPSKATK